ncbi:hypothetical protein HDU78_000756, partial [Chytriomyces hyalinus]
ATRPSSLSRLPRLVAAPTIKSSPPSVEAAVAAESVPGLISWVSVATGASTPSRLSRTGATKLSPAQATTTPTAANPVTPNRKTIPKTPDVKVAAGMSGLINCSPAATRPSSLSRLPRFVAAPATKSSTPYVEAAVAAVPGLISSVSAASAAPSSLRLHGTVATKISTAQAGVTSSQIRIPLPFKAKMALAKQTSLKAGGPCLVQRPTNGNPVAHPVVKPKREPSTLFSNPKLHKLLRNPRSRKDIKTSGALMYKQRPIRL